MRLWFPTTAYAASAVAHAEMALSGTGVLLSSMETAPGVYNVPDQFADSVLAAIPSLSPKPLYADTVLGLAPFAYWPLGEPSGNAVDLIGSRALVPNGAGMLRAQPSIIPNGEGAATVFSGANAERLRQATDDASFDFTGLSPFSITAWTYTTLADTVTAFGISKRSTAGSIGGNLFLFRNASNTPTLYRYDNVGASQTSSGAANLLTAGTIIHYVGTYDGTLLKTYVNGVVASSVTSNLSQGDSSNNLTIGGDAAASSSSWAGGIQEVAFWNRALSADEIETLWRAGH